MVELLVLFSPVIALGFLFGWSAVSAFVVGSPLWIALAVLSAACYGFITHRTARSDTPDGGAGGIGWLCMTVAVACGVVVKLILLHP